MWQKAGEQNKREDSPLARGPRVKTRRPAGLRHRVPSVDFVENGGEMLGGGGGQCLCEREAGLRDAARENGNNVIRVALRRKATSMRCSYTCNVVSQQMWN